MNIFRVVILKIFVATGLWFKYLEKSRLAGGGGSWVEVTSDTNDFNMACEYKWVPTSSSYNGNGFYASLVQNSRVVMSWMENETAQVNSGNKALMVSDVGNISVRTYERCGGSGTAEIITFSANKNGVQLIGTEIWTKI